MPGAAWRNGELFPGGKEPGAIALLATGQMQGRRGLRPEMSQGAHVIESRL